MRRLLAVSLLLLFNLPLISPLFALTENSDANLPACCRRNGIHHCNMRMSPQSVSSGAAFSSTPIKCPAYPRPAALIRITHAQAQAGEVIVADPTVSASIALLAETRAKAVVKSPRRKRGPPTTSLN